MISWSKHPRGIVVGKNNRQNIVAVRDRQIVWREGFGVILQHTLEECCKLDLSETDSLLRHDEETFVDMVTNIRNPKKYGIYYSAENWTSEEYLK
jgi:hypothetical protein